MSIHDSQRIPQRETPRLSWKHQLVSKSVQALDLALPPLSSRLVFNYFIHARRRKDTHYKANLPAGARRIEITHNQQHLVGWSWGESGPHILLVHGWEGHAGQMLHMVIPLLQQGFRVTTFDMPGHGLSPKSATDIVDMGRATGHAIEQFGPFDGIVAHSLGGAGVSIMLARNPHLLPRKLVLLSPGRDLAQHVDTFARLANLSARRKAGLQAHLARRIGSAVEACSTVQAVASIPIPGLIIHDRADVVVPHSTGVELATAWRGARLIETHGLGHRHGLKDAGVIGAIVEFLRD